MAQIQNDGPKTFREVAYILATIQKDVRDMKESQRRMVGYVITGFIMPLAAGLILGYMFKGQ